MPPTPRGSNPAALQAAVGLVVLDVEQAAAAAPPLCSHSAVRASKREAATTATRLTPTIACEELTVREQDERYIVLLPVAQSPTGLVVMVPTDNDVACFGVELNPLAPAKDQAERAARHLTVGIETQYICTARDNGDIIVCVPWDECPMAYASKPAGIASARTAGHRTVRASISALAGSAAYAFATLASLRMQAMQGSSLGDDLVVGIHNTARPVVTQREAARYARAQSVLPASEEWTTFLASERLAGNDIASALRAEDEGDGVLRRLADNVRTAADFGGELPTPEQGLPRFQDHRLRVYLYPARPPPLITAWLLRLPAQSVPPGFQPLPWSDILRRWARRMIVDQFNASMTYDAHC